MAQRDAPWVLNQALAVASEQCAPREPEQRMAAPGVLAGGWQHWPVVAVQSSRRNRRKPRLLPDQHLIAAKQQNCKTTGSLLDADQRLEADYSPSAA